MPAGRDGCSPAARARTIADRMCNNWSPRRQTCRHRITNSRRFRARHRPSLRWSTNFRSWMSTCRRHAGCRSLIDRSDAARKPRCRSLPCIGERAFYAVDPPAPRDHPLRFMWQMDAEGRFSLDSDEFTRPDRRPHRRRIRTAVERHRRDVRTRPRRPCRPARSPPAAPGAASPWTGRSMAAAGCRSS